jgi:hypothetical protein
MEERDMAGSAVAATQAVDAAKSREQQLLCWSAAQAAGFGSQSVVAKHRLHRLELFSDAALLDLLENYPRERLQAFTMGADPLNWRDWRPVDTTGVSGRQLFEAVTRGRFWLNILQVHLVDRRYRDLIDDLFAEISDQCSGFRPLRTYGTLLISSPTAMVYYHVDAQPNLLWHIRGAKRVWIYPAGDKELISQDLLEDIFANFADEEVPYRAEFDQKATSFDLLPGDVVSWPQNAPHRVTNLEGLNVSLSTPYETEDSDRRKIVYCANRLFRRTYRLPAWSTKETGLLACIKRTAYRAWHRAGLVEVPPRRAYVTNLRIDPHSPTGFRELADGPVLTEFSQKDFILRKDALGQVSVVPTR